MAQIMVWLLVMCYVDFVWAILAEVAGTFVNLLSFALDCYVFCKVPFDL